MSRPARALCLLLLALALGATAVRAARLARGEALTAHGERLWFGWAYRHPGVAAQLARATADLATGETVWLAVDAGPDDARWLRVIARYHLPEQEIGGIVEPGTQPPADARVVAVDLARRDGTWKARSGGAAGGATPAAGGGGPAGAATRGIGGGTGSETATGEAGAGWPREAAAVLLGALAALAVGLAALRPRSPAGALAAAPLAGIAGLALLTAALYPLWRLAVPAGPASVLGTAAALAGALSLFRRLGGRAVAPGLDGDAGSDAPAALTASTAPTAGRGRGGWLDALVWLPAAAALAAFGWKLTLVPLWSWDHYAIWGFKARRLFPDGVLDVGWLVPTEFARPDYPLGLPLAWRVLTLGAEPGPAAFAAVHALMAVSLVALVGRAASRLGGGVLAGGAAAALAAASPLLWDTESFGLADLPLALWAVAAVAAVTAAAPRPAATGFAAPLWIAGACLGFLPWLKSEGLPLALLLLAALAVAIAAATPAACATGRPAVARAHATADPAPRPAAESRSATGHRRRSTRRRRGDLLALGLPACLLGAAGLAATPALGAREVGFFRDDWAGRAAARVGEAPGILRAMAADLLEPGWLGIWPLWALATAVLAAVAIVGRLHRRAATAAGLALSAAVALQLGVYFATYLATHLPPEQHLRTSFFRVAAALAPLALVAATSALGAAGGARPLSPAAAAAPPPAAGGRG